MSSRGLYICLSLLLCSGCVEELSVAGQPCPCADGYWCDRAGGGAGTCRQGSPPPDAGPPDTATEPDAQLGDAMPDGVADIAVDGPDPDGPEPCQQITSLIDRFDDGHFDDWKAVDGEVSLEDDRLLLIRTPTTGAGKVMRSIDVGTGPFRIGYDVAFNVDEVFSGMLLTKAGSTKAYALLLTSDVGHEKRPGVHLLSTPGSYALPETPTLLSKAMTPSKGTVYRVELAWQPGGQFEIFLDGTSVGTATDVTLTQFDQLQLYAGQDSNGGAGAHFDNLEIRSCGEVPSLTPSADNPIWTGSGVVSLIKDQAGYKLYHNVDGTSFSLDTSTDRKSWTTTPDVLTSAHTGHPYNRALVVLEVGGAYQAWLNGTSEDCIEFAPVFGATSSDGVTWLAQGEVMSCGALGTYDARNANVDTIVHDGNSYHLYYVAMATSGGDQCAGGPNLWRSGIGYASSPDGSAWTKHGIAIPLGLPGDPDEQDAVSPVVQQRADGFEMFYLGTTNAGNPAIMYATSPDALSWTKQGPVAGEGAAPVALLDDELYYACGTGLCVGAIGR